MPTNNRVWWACEAVGLKADGNTGSYTVIHGLQSVGINCNFNLQQFFEVGQSEIYENVEDLPDIEITLEKVLDGYPLAYHLVTRGYPTNTLAGRANQRTIVALSVFGDTQDSASGTPLVTAHASGFYANSLSYTFPTDGAFTESVTLIGNNIVHKAGGSAIYGSTFSGTLFDNTDTPLSLPSSGGINFREDLLWGSGNSRIPTQIPGVQASGWIIANTDGSYPVHVTSVSVSADLGREAIHELGRKGPYSRNIKFPVEITTEIEIIALSGVLIDATEAAAAGSGNLVNEPILIKTREGTSVDVGVRNKLQSWTYGGGDAGGDNATIKYTYVGYNHLIVTHPQDPIT